MTPLDLTKTAPRSPGQEVNGLCMLPRMIDIARAKLPGGNPGEYQIGRDKTLSAAVLNSFGISVSDFVQLVFDAETDKDIVGRLWPRAVIPPAALSRRLRRITVADVPSEVRPDFHRLYGTDLPPDRRVFDVIDEDDAQLRPE